MLIRRHDEDRELLRALFREADDSESAIDGYLSEGEILTAVEDDGRIVGHLQLIDGGDGTIELKSMAVDAAHRGGGVGRALVTEAIARCYELEATRLLVATAAADVGNLRFYQRQGFRMASVERDAFGPGSGYEEGIIIDGIPLRDRVWLDLDL